jgi:beta-galactosidase
MRLYTPFYNINTNIDVISVNRKFNKYKVLLVPTLQLIDEELAKRFEEFVSNGGTIIFSYRAGIKDKNNNINFKSTIPCNVRDICGIEINEIESLQYGQEVKITGVGKYEGEFGQCEVWRDLVTPTTAEVLFKYDDKFYNDKSCVTVNRHGNGKVFYVGGGVNPEILNVLAKEITLENNIRYLESEEGLEVYLRDLNKQEYAIITNHTDEVKTFNNVAINPYESKILLRNS